MIENLVPVSPEQSLALQKVSQGLFKSGMFPNAKNEYGAFCIVEYGHELGIPPMMALKNINIISGQLAANGQLMLSLAMQRGVTFEVLEETDKGAKIKFKRGSVEYTATFDEKDAKAADLLNKDNWKKYARDMYYWRAVAKGIRRVAPDATMGLYTPDELSEGKYIDVAEVAVPQDAQPLQEINPIIALATKLKDLMIAMGHAKTAILPMLSLRVGRELKKLSDMTEEEIRQSITDLETEYARAEQDKGGEDVTNHSV